MENEQYLTLHIARSYGGERNNPVKDYSLVEKRNTPTSLRMPSGMRPVGSNKVSFLRNARNRVEYNFYRAVFPTGMKWEIKTKIESWRFKTSLSYITKI